MSHAALALYVHARDVLTGNRNEDIGVEKRVYSREGITAPPEIKGP